jgi:gentisate 1,2-dioxygenase
MTARLALTRHGLALLLLTVGSATHAAELNPDAVAFKTPDQFKWRDPSRTAANNQTVLYGDPTKPGLYIYINTATPGHLSSPHTHPNDRFIMVMKGPWSVGSRTTQDPARAVAMPVGTFVTHHGKQVHWDGAKDDATEILIIGEGPATNIPAEKTDAQQPSGPDLDPKAVSYVRPDQYKWRDPTQAAPTNQVNFVGDSSKSEFYATINRFKPGNFSRPHFHPNDRFITVLKGTWWVGTGSTFNPDSTVPMKPGTFVTHVGKQVHYDGAKDEEAVVLIVGKGPATLTHVAQ